MSKNDMLAAIVRALVGVPQKRLGVVLDTVNKIGSVDGELWRTRFAEVLREGVKPAVLLPEAPLDTLIRVDRSIRPVYPDWVKTVTHPELECAGPAEYNLQTEVEQWLHDDQKNGSVEGNTIYRNLRNGNTLATCLNLQDGFAIQAKGIEVFRELFGGKSLVLWGSVLLGPKECGGLLVPYLYGRYGDSGQFGYSPSVPKGGYVVIDWTWLFYFYGSDKPALRFSK